MSIELDSKLEVNEDHQLELEDILSYFEDMDFNELTPVDTNSDTIKISRFMAQAEYKIEVEVKTDKNGKQYTKKTTTPNDEKIADTCIEIFQRSNWDEKLNYKDLRKNALLMLEPKFKRAGLTFEKKDLTATEKLEISRRREIGISQTIRTIISKTINTTIEYDFDEFIARTGIKSASKLSYALQLLKEVQSKAFYQWKQPILSDDYKEVLYEFVTVSQIPTITILLTEEGGELYKDLDDFIASKATNKRKYIKGIKFDLNNSFVPYLIGLGRDYANVFRKERNKFVSGYSFKLDMHLKSIVKVQHIDAFNKYNFKKLQGVFGTSYEDYRNFKRYVLDPAIKDLNNHTNYDVEFIEFRYGNKQKTSFEYGRFRITPKLKTIQNKKFGVNPTAYYISSRLYYFSSVDIKNITAFAKGIEKELYNKEKEGILDLFLYGEKYLTEWQEEAKEALKIECEISDLLAKHSRFIAEHGIIYDYSRMCIMEEFTRYDNETQLDIKDKRYVTSGAKKVTNPMESIEYLNMLIENEITHKANIVDYLPFEYFNSKGRVKVTTANYEQHQEEIKRLIVEKKTNHFILEDPIREIFINNILRDNFLQIDQDFKEMVYRIAGK